VGELGPEAQAKLLRALETGEVQPEGSDTPKHVDVWVVCASHRSLLTLVAEGRFRADLFHRLVHETLRVPPLRARLEDLPALVRHLARRRPQGAQVVWSPEALAALAHHAWPGNVRELEGVVFNLLSRAASGVVEAAQVEAVLGVGRVPVADDDARLALAGRSLAELLGEIYEKAVRRHGGNKTAAAAELRVGRKRFRELDVDAVLEGRREVPRVGLQAALALRAPPKPNR
jgi:DNA-binding NtrC family response regulator